jgi:hypothetical protein
VRGGREKKGEEKEERRKWRDGRKEGRRVEEKN